MKLYYSKGACSLAINILIHELGLPCEYIAVDLKTHKTAAGDDFYQINPKGSVPVLVLDNGEILTENAVIHQYLADKNTANHFLPPLNDLKRYRTLEWLNFVTTEMHKGCAPFFNPNLPQEAKDKVFIPNIKNKLNYLEKHLEKNKYLMGDNFMLPDGYLFTILNWLKYFTIDIKEWPNVSRYFDAVKNRQAVQAALKQEGLA